MQNRIVLVREHLGLTVADVAEKIGVPAATLSAWEAGESDPTLDQAVALAFALEVPTDFLFCR